MLYQSSENINDHPNSTSKYDSHGDCVPCSCSPVREGQVEVPPTTRIMANFSVHGLEHLFCTSATELCGRQRGQANQDQHALADESEERGRAFVLYADSFIRGLAHQ